MALQENRGVRSATTHAPAPRRARTAAREYSRLEELILPDLCESDGARAVIRSQTPARHDAGGATVESMGQPRHAA